MGYAQQGEKVKKLKALKTTYITNELELTPQEAEKFWPIYNKYEKEVFELKVKKLRQLVREINQSQEELTETKALEKLNEIASIEEKINALDKKLIEDLKPILSNVKILKLKIAEIGFQRKLIQQRTQSSRKPKDKN